MSSLQRADRLRRASRIERLLWRACAPASVMSERDNTMEIYIPSDLKSVELQYLGRVFKMVFYVQHRRCEQKVAHGVSRGTSGQKAQAPEGRKKTLYQALILSPLRGLVFQQLNPRLTPWATLFRCSAAKTNFENTA